MLGATASVAIQARQRLELQPEARGEPEGHRDLVPGRLQTAPLMRNVATQPVC